MTKEIKQRLQQLYNDKSKHANYQNIPGFIRQELNYTEFINEEWRGDSARYDLLTRLLDINNFRVIGDIGANTGFFTLSMAHQYKASHFIAYENNPNHVEFMGHITSYFKMSNVVINPVTVDLASLSALPAHDLILHLNVLHHAGHDFDAQIVPNASLFYAYGRDYLAGLASICKTVFFQMGSNWCGNKETPIIALKNDTEKILFIARMFRESHWQIAEVALPTRNADGKIVYESMPLNIVEALNKMDIQSIEPSVSEFVQTCDLDQFVGEFYRRPIFLCHSG